LIRKVEMIGNWYIGVSIHGARRYERARKMKWEKKVSSDGKCMSPAVQKKKAGTFAKVYLRAERSVTKVRRNQTLTIGCAMSTSSLFVSVSEGVGGGVKLKWAMSKEH